MIRPLAPIPFLFLAPLFAQDPYLVSDLHPAGSSATEYSILGRGPRPAELLVALDDGVRGTELWRTDGTVAGTVLVAELVPGPAGATFGLGTGDSADCFFVADRGFGREMWRTDGTAAGTRLLFAAASFGLSTIQPPQLPARVGNQWLFGGDGKLFVSDGTVAGTALVGVGEFAGALAFGGRFYIEDFQHLQVLEITPATPPVVNTFADAYVSSIDGEPILSRFTVRPFPAPQTSTTLVAIARPGQPSVAGIAGQVFPFQFRDRLVYVDENHGLWSWDIVTPPVRVASNVAAPTAAPILVDLGDRLLFVGSDPTNGNEPWTTDGTAAGTQVIDLTPGPASTNFFFVGGVTQGQRAVLWRNTAATGMEPWATDGTVAGTVQLADLEPGPQGSQLELYTGFGGQVGQRRLILAVRTSARGNEPWITDGTVAGSRFLAEIVPGPGDGLASIVGIMGQAGHRLVFTADDLVHGSELWAFDLEGSTSLYESQGTRAFAVRGDAVVGATVEFASSGLAAADLGAVAIGWPATAAALGTGGTFLHVDLGLSLPLLPIVPNSNGDWSLSVVVPNLPGLVGLDLVAQAGFMGPSTGTGIELGSAYWLGIGN